MIVPATRHSEARGLLPRDRAPGAPTDDTFASTLPDLVTPAALAAMTGMTESATCRQIRAGLWGPYARIGRRYVLRRDSLLAALAEREVYVAPRPHAPVARPPAWAKHLPPPHPGRRRT